MRGASEINSTLQRMVTILVITHLTIVNAKEHQKKHSDNPQMFTKNICDCENKFDHTYFYGRSKVVKNSSVKEKPLHVNFL